MPEKRPSHFKFIADGFFDTQLSPPFNLCEGLFTSREAESYAVVGCCSCSDIFWIFLPLRTLQHVHCYFCKLVGWSNFSKVQKVSFFKELKNSKIKISKKTDWTIKCSFASRLVFCKTSFYLFLLPWGSVFLQNWCKCILWCAVLKYLIRARTKEHALT